MLDVPEVGMKVLHSDLGVGKITTKDQDSYTVYFLSRHEVKFKNDEQNVSLVEKSTVSQLSSPHRLGPKMDPVIQVLREPVFRTHEEISELSGYENLNGLAAGIRALRKTENGSHTIEKRRREGSAEYEYRMVV